jgi:hypothetical protein
MVAFTSRFTPAESLSRSKNRAGDFFWTVGDRAGVDRSATRISAGENDWCSYDACRGSALPQQGEWKPTKENCDDLRAQYPEAFKNPSQGYHDTQADVFPDPLSAVLAAAYQSAAYTSFYGHEHISAAYVGPDGQRRVAFPQPGSSPVGGEFRLRNFPETTVTYTALAHGHNIGFDVATLYHPTRVQTEADYMYYGTRQSGNIGANVPGGDLGTILETGIGGIVYGADNKIYYADPSMIKADAGTAATNLLHPQPSATVNFRIVECLKADLDD